MIVSGCQHWTTAELCRQGRKKGGIGVPSVLLPGILLFLNDCIVAPEKLRPSGVARNRRPPIRTASAAPDARTPVPKLFTRLAPVIVKLRTAVAMARTPSPPLVATIPPCSATSIGPLLNKCHPTELFTSLVFAAWAVADSVPGTTTIPPPIVVEIPL